MQSKLNKGLTKEDLELLQFIAKYKMIKVEYASLIYKTKRYYRERINRLLEQKYIKKYKSYVILDRKGRKELGISGTCYLKNIDNKPYMDRLKELCNIATITIGSNIEFIPSWNIKEKDKFTDVSRKYLGIMTIVGNEFLVYYISSKKQHVYIQQILFDVNKSSNYSNIIIFTDNYNVICDQYNNLAFGKENTYVIANNRNKEIIKNYDKIDLHEILQEIYKEELLISDWELADYRLEDGSYIIKMPFINTEKIQRLNWHYKENVNVRRKLIIATLEENKETIEQILLRPCEIVTLNEFLIMGGAN